MRNFLLLAFLAQFFSAPITTRSGDTVHGSAIVRLGKMDTGKWVAEVQTSGYWQRLEGPDTGAVAQINLLRAKGWEPVSMVSSNELRQEWLLKQNEPNWAALLLGCLCLAQFAFVLYLIKKTGWKFGS